jgi:hypothetical protein
MLDYLQNPFIFILLQAAIIGLSVWKGWDICAKYTDKAMLDSTQLTITWMIENEYAIGREREDGEWELYKLDVANAEIKNERN